MVKALLYNAIYYSFAKYIEIQTFHFHSIVISCVSFFIDSDRSLFQGILFKKIHYRWLEKCSRTLFKQEAVEIITISEQ